MLWSNVFKVPVEVLGVSLYNAGLGSSTVDQVLKYTKYIPSTSTGQVLIFLKRVLKYIKYFHIKYKYKYSY